MKQVEIIQRRLRATQSRQKSYVNRCRGPLEFETGDHVFLRVSQTTVVGRALRAKKLIPKFIGLYQILHRKIPIAYELALPPQLERLHNIRDELSVELPAALIENTRVKELRGKSIRLVKVIWDSITGDTTWELEDRMREQFPHLFSNE
ncbi:uncharacterized protein LOC113866606 [Abrus precatorius]|uniref:Uncharacterized protein LOC113866606 n=1 Tax=Abrus precatorius TaxID=3816 RepID=A0A8B8LP88_ABRPR|nr:uncharacterized protein LOC113866606 [Abrus precatorius]